METWKASYLELYPDGATDSDMQPIRCERLYPPSTQANLLIPERLIERFRFRLSIHRSPTLYLNYLLKTYQEALLAMIRFSDETNHPNRIYQHRGLDLVRSKIWISQSLWKEFSELSHLTGYSCCRLFTMLLQLDLKTPPGRGYFILPSRWKLVRCLSEIRESTWEFFTAGQFTNHSKTKVYKLVKSLLV